MAEEREKDFDPLQLKEGALLTCTNYYTVRSVVGNDVHVTDQDNHPLEISADIVKNECVPCDTQKHVERVTRTEMARILENAGQRAFVVTFTTKPDEKVGTEALEAEWAGANTQAKRRKIVKEKVLVGRRRVLRGYLRSSDHLMGRADVIDLDEKMKGAFPIRQVDYRTLEELEIGNVKYLLKK